MMALDRRDGLFFVVIFFGLLVRLALAPPIWHHGEAREGLVVQGIVHNHEWILPLRNGEMPSKPPFFHWLAALPAFVFGPSDWIVRLPSAIGAAIMAAATFFMGSQMGGRRTGWLAAGALLGMHEFWISGSQARVDMVFAACIAVALAGFFFWYRDGHRGARATCYVASACAVLAKGPVGLILPGLTIISFLIFEGRFRHLWAFWSWPLAALVLLLDLGWYAFAYDIGGNEFLSLQIATENLDRFFGHGPFSTENTSFDTLVWLANTDAPLEPGFGLVADTVNKGRRARIGPAVFFTHGGFRSSLFFVVAARSRPVYLLPMYPAIALLAARAIGDRIPVFAEDHPILSPLRKLGHLGGAQKKSSIRVGVGVAIFDVTLMLLVSQRIGPIGTHGTPDSHSSKISARSFHLVNSFSSLPNLTRPTR